MEDAKLSKYSKVPPVGTYVRHLKTGDLAKIIERDGELFIKPDLPGSPVEYPANQIYNWQIEKYAKRLPPGSWARVCYEADRALCDIHPELKRQREWLSLGKLEKATWIERKVKFDSVLRLELYNAITAVLEANSE